MSAPRQSMRASQMSFVLIGILIALICILVGGSVLEGTLLYKKSVDATHAQIDADVSAGDANRLEALKQYLANNASGISQIASLTAGLGQYDQNTIVARLSSYANTSGVTISGFDFGSGATVPMAGAATASSGTVNVTLGSPVSYQKFILFLRLLEQGLMPAEVTNVQISGDADSSDNIIVSALTIQVAQ